MTKRMLIDATHDEETRVAVIENNRLEEYDYESQSRKPLKGSIFLAKVTRVEPSLQAAFVNFGGNRHGFLPFSEIHPDYFRIPISDREALMAEHEAFLAEDEEEEEAAEKKEKEEELKTKPKSSSKSKPKDAAEDSVSEDGEEEPEEIVEQLGGEGPPDSEEEFEYEEEPEEEEAEAEEENPEDSVGNCINDGEVDDSDGNAIAGGADDVDGNKDPEEKSDGRRRHSNRGGRGGRGRGGRNNNRGGRGRAASSRGAEKYGDKGQSAEQRFRSNLRRKYKIQEVIKRGQIMLVQVNKEERGNKGAAVGSYLSLPGRYCVLMPNSPRAGGVSRKIANYKDRARMRELMKELEVPKGMSVILRTAGVTRTKTEIKRDLDYLMRLWNNIRELTLESSAPSIVYEEADLIKRVVRDIYTREIEEIWVAGDEAYKNAKEFMKMMIPSHVKRVKEYKYKEENAPLFTKYKVEEQIVEIGETQVTLPSGGYLVINPTEALISIDVNSGRATKGRHIEETALKTNLETAVEVARQLRLRDLGGLVVIDFIDMEDRRNNAKVERKMRDSLSGDRARIQMGRISSFGLMELSRQRMNPSLSEAQSEVCPHCSGSGRVRTVDATAILVLRAIEDEGFKGRASQLVVHVSNKVAQYVLNNKRQSLADLEKRHNLTILIHVDDEVGGDNFRIEVSKPAGKSDDEVVDSEKVKNNEPKSDDDGQRKPRRRGRRGGRRRGRREEGENDGENAPQDDAQNQGHSEDALPQEDKAEAGEEKLKPKRGRKPSVKKDSDKSEKVTEEKPKATSKKPASKAKADKDEKLDEKPEAEEKLKSKAKTKPKAKKEAAPSNDDGPSVASQHETVNEAPKKKKRGWWSKDTD